MTRRAGTRPAWQLELLVVAFLLLGYDRVADLAQLRVAAADSAGRALLRLEQQLHVSLEPALVGAVAGHRRTGQALAVYYDLAHGLVTIGVLAGLYLLRPAGYRRARRALVAVNLVALGVFVALPVTPPRLLAGSGVVDVVARSGTWASWSTGSLAARHADEYASLPSLHVAWAVWVVLAVHALTRSPAARAAAGVHLGLTVLVVLATGNHYVVDVLAGGLLSAAVWPVVAGRPAAGPARGVPRPVAAVAVGDRTVSP